MHTHAHKHNSINCVQTINIFPVPTCLLVKLFAVYWIGLVRSCVYISVYIVLHNVHFWELSALHPVDHPAILPVFEFMGTNEQLDNDITYVHHTCFLESYYSTTLYIS